MMRDRRLIAQLLRDTIVRLCKTNTLYNGPVEIDGIICISGQVEGEEFVVKVHERIGAPGLAAGDPDYFCDDPKRRRVDYDQYNPWGGRFAPGYGSYGHSFGMPDDFGNGDIVKDLSMKRQSSRHTNGVSTDPNGISADHNGPYMARPAERAEFPLHGRQVNGSWSPPFHAASHGVPHCRVCAVKFESAVALCEHNEATHGVFTCAACCKTFTSRSNLERHSRLHTGAKPYACGACGKSFSRKDHLSNHAAKHAWRCGECAARCTDRATLAAHCVAEHGRMMLAEVCAYCNRGFVDRSTYESHVRSHPQYHEGGGARGEGGGVRGESGANQDPGTAEHPRRKRKRFSCDRCYFESADSAEFSMHAAAHRADDFDCATPNPGATPEPKVASRIRRIGGSSALYECCVCRLVCGSPDELRKHEEGAHGARIWSSGDMRHVAHDRAALDYMAERYRCRRCERSFDSYHILCEHEGIHDEEEDAARKPTERVSPTLERPESVNATTKRGNESSPTLKANSATTERRNGLSPALSVNVTAELERAISEAEFVTVDELAARAEHFNRHKSLPRDSCRDAGEIGDIGESWNSCGGGGSFGVGEKKRDKRKQKQPKAAVVNDSEDDDIIEANRHLPSTSLAVANNGITNDVINYESTTVAIKTEPVWGIMNRMATREETSGLSDLLTTSRQDASDLSLAIGEDLSMLKQKIPSPMPSEIGRKTAYRTRSRRSAGGSPEASRRSSAVGNRRSSSADTTAGSILGDRGNFSSANDPARNMARLGIAPRFGWGSEFAPPDCPECAICQRVATSLEDAEAHCFSAHARFPCAFCTRTFAQRANRDRHVCLHTGERPYECAECGEAFSRGDRLKKHRMREHEVQYPSYSSRGGGAERVDREDGGSPFSFEANQFADEQDFLAVGNDSKAIEFCST